MDVSSVIKVLVLVALVRTYTLEIQNCFAAFKPQNIFNSFNFNVIVVH